MLKPNRLIAQVRECLAKGKPLQVASQPFQGADVRRQKSELKRVSDL
jgi:hypothetical protein